MPPLWGSPWPRRKGTVLMMPKTTLFMPSAHLMGWVQLSFQEGTVRLS